jgi:5-formyltetrahydrofolate cyclo-ligase
MDKPALRREVFQRIKAIPLAERERRSAEVCDRLAEQPGFAGARLVCAYLALPSEPDLGALMARFPEKTWAVPRVDPETERLRFHLLPSPETVVRGPHGILEPESNAPEAPSAPDLVLVPGVAFDPASLARLGRGKGHYDRFLGGLRERSPGSRFVGVGFREQACPLAAEAHDVPMHALAWA